MIAGLLLGAMLNAANLRPQLDDGLAKLAGAGPHQAPALSVAVAQNGKITYAHGFGTADAQTPFRIGSVTKMFTAVSIMQLVSAHKLTLDQRVSTILPSAPYADKITVRELLQHTSGLWNYGDAALATGAAAHPTTPQAILKLVAQHPLDSTPGTAYAYSNSGYVVLGLIVEKLTRLPLATYERMHIFNPAHMQRTSVGAGTLPRASYDPSWFYADGDIVSTASDLARFDLALMNGTLLPKAIFAQMQQSTVATPAPDVRWGLGLSIVTQGGQTYVGHHGGLPDYTADNEMLLNERTALIVLANSAHFLTTGANATMLAVLDPSLVARAQASAATPPPEDPAVTARFRTALTSLMHGTIDRTQYSADVNGTLTPAVLASTKRQLAPLGSIEKIVYAGLQSSLQGKEYLYNVTFSSGLTIRWGFALTSDGKIAGIVGLGQV